uniref:Uncharacterized protein n=1 Tax=Arundo donax TaxID=35708 RepID=A0A0A9C4K3_ARUDO
MRPRFTDQVRALRVRR